VQSKRIEALADGIFAIAMTILVLQVQVPRIPPPVTQDALRRALLQLTPHVTGYFVSFVLLGSLWVAHHAQFHFIRKVDRVLLWLNIFYLSLISFVPFASGLLSQYHRQPVACAVYAATMLAAVALLYAQWTYATNGRRLVPADLDEGIVNAAKRRMGVAFAVYLAAGLLSFVDAWVGLLLFVITPLAYMLPNPLDRHLGR